MSLRIPGTCMARKAGESERGDWDMDQRIVQEIIQRHLIPVVMPQNEKLAGLERQGGA